MIVVLCALAALLFVTPSWRRIAWRRPVHRGTVDQAVILDMAAAALKAGVALPAMLQAMHAAMSDTSISGVYVGEACKGAGGSGVLPSLRLVKSTQISRHRNLEEVSNMLLMGAAWDEAWEGVAPVYLRVGSVLAPAWNDGVAPVALLERGAQGLRASRARRAKEAAARLGSKLVVPLAACYLPAFMLLGVLPVVVAAAEKLF